jgi:hypothetical protein
MTAYLLGVASISLAAFSDGYFFTSLKKLILRS